MDDEQLRKVIEAHKTTVSDSIVRLGDAIRRGEAELIREHADLIRNAAYSFAEFIENN